jgi:hypothetical protein
MRSGIETVVEFDVTDRAPRYVAIETNEIYNPNQIDFPPVYAE